MNICYIVGALNEAFHPFKYDDSDLIIACDKGYSILKCSNYRIDLIVGDFDSLGYVPKENNVLVLPKEKDVTDLHQCIEEGIKKGYSSFEIFGAIGGRFDHSIASIQDCYKYKIKGYNIKLYSSTQVIDFLFNEKKEVFKEKGYISVFSLSDVSKGVRIKNLKYELDNYELKNTFPLGVSNEFINKKASIEVDDGCLIIIY